MRQRCNNKRNVKYYRYGGRGIKVCRAWNNFETFLKDMGERPLNHELHRKDNDGDYEPNNCVWLHEDKHTKPKHQI